MRKMYEKLLSLHKEPLESKPIGVKYFVREETIAKSFTYELTLKSS